jgi:type IV pilus assembly protein PilE
MKKQAGFTLVELVIAMVIVAILASIALPSYRDSVRKSERRAAQAAMMQIANLQHQYFVSNRAYGTKDDLGYELPPEVSGKYTLTIQLSEEGLPPAFTIKMTAADAKEASYGVLSLDSAGEKKPEGKW